ncbi:MAG TPA: MBL fold metallo-hydrolase [Chloroflexota bacterium]|nr:MBL fold metallo-hydrolase [Chloroflexota bacterium]
MTAFLCETCGVQHAPRADRPDEPPIACPICLDERQYVGPKGQRWTTIERLRAERTNHLDEPEPNLLAVETRPGFAIGQRALLVQTPAGNLLWDCTPLLDDAVVGAIQARGGVQAIAISHPHFYSAMVEWSRAFGGAPIWLHAADRAHVMRPDPAIRHWDGPTADPLPGSGLTLVNVGGHFDGQTALHWPAGAEGRGVLCSADMPQVVADRRWVTFMYSYPNLIPLPTREVRRIADLLARYPFDRLYGGWTDRVVERDASAAVARSAARYVEHLG